MWGQIAPTDRVLGGKYILHVVLVEPEIPANTGNIARLCAATGTSLHLIRPLGFFLTDPKLKRAGLDYWEYLDLHIHDSLEDFLEDVRPERLFLVETGGKQLYTEAKYLSGDFFLFGSETKGLAPELIERYQDNIVTIPQINVRSLNLANTVAIIVYEAWRQLDFVNAKNLF